LNNFKYVQKGLGDTVGRGMLRTDIQRGEQQISRDGIVGSGVYCDMTTVDAFAAENNIKIDFIKSDIEGYERYMLRGAEYVLKNHQPKLSLKIYHNNYEDAYVLPEIISSINPNYKMIMRKNVMYAYV
jgi:FkbM family methyltransferase